MQNPFDVDFHRLHLRFVDAHDEWTDAEIATVERTVGFSLPVDYRTFMKKYGLCAGSKLCFRDPDRPFQPGGSIHTFFGIDPTGNNDIISEWEGSRETTPERLLPICDSSGASICISGFGPDAGCVYEYTNEYNRLRDDDNGELLLSPNFTHFIRSIYNEKDPASRIPDADLVQYERK